jgi:hypothetical protein
VTAIMLALTRIRPARSFSALLRRLPAQSKRAMSSDGFKPTLLALPSLAPALALEVLPSGVTLTKLFVQADGRVSLLWRLFARLLITIDS